MRWLDQGIGTLSPAPSAETVDVLVELLAEIDAAAEGDDFYDRVCEGLCRLTSMERAGLFLYDRTLRTVRAVGSAGVDPDLLEDVAGARADPTSPACNPAPAARSRFTVTSTVG